MQLHSARQHKSTHINRVLIICTLFLAFAVGALFASADGNSPERSSSPSSATTSSAFVVAAYVPEYRLGHVHDHANFVLPRLTDVLLFSVEPSSDGTGVQAVDRVLWDGEIPERFRRATRLQKLNDPDTEAASAAAATAAAAAAATRFSLCIGGAGRSENFRAVVKSEQNARAFARSVKAFLDEHDLDGVDIDWEAQFEPQEMERLLQAMAAELHSDNDNDHHQTGSDDRHDKSDHPQTQRRRRKLRLTVAIHHFTPMTEAAFAAVDGVHIMAYDLHSGPGGHSSMAHAQQVAAMVLKAGCPPAKLILGLPAYSRRIGAPGDVKTYSELIDLDAANALRDETPDGHAYNGPSTIRAKVLWAKEVGLGGVMLWEAGQDTTDASTSLLAAMHDSSSSFVEDSASGKASAGLSSRGRKKKFKKKKKETRRTEL